MFIRAEFHLKGPICNCQRQDLSWGVLDGDGGYGLLFRCRLCGTELHVSYKEFKAGFVLKQPYPEGVENKAPKVKRKRIGKVVELFPVSEEK